MQEPQLRRSFDLIKPRLSTFGSFSAEFCKSFGKEKIQWNPSMTDTFGEQCFGLYIRTEVAFVQFGQ